MIEKPRTEGEPVVGSKDKPRFLTMSQEALLQLISRMNVDATERLANESLTRYGAGCPPGCAAKK